MLGWTFTWESRGDTLSCLFTFLFSMLVTVSTKRSFGCLFTCYTSFPTRLSILTDPTVLTPPRFPGTDHRLLLRLRVMFLCGQIVRPLLVYLCLPRTICLLGLCDCMTTVSGPPSFDLRFLTLSFPFSTSQSGFFSLFVFRFPLSFSL